MSIEYFKAINRAKAELENASITLHLERGSLEEKRKVFEIIELVDKIISNF